LTGTFANLVQIEEDVQAKGSALFCGTACQYFRCILCSGPFQLLLCLLFIFFVCSGRVCSCDGLLMVSADLNAAGAIGSCSGCKMAGLFIVSWPRHQLYESWPRYHDVFGDILSRRKYRAFMPPAFLHTLTRRHATNSTPTQYPLKTHSTPAQRRIPRTFT